jgi:hypothetical protein
MAQIAPLLARLKRNPIADLPIADHFNQLLRQSNCVWRDRLLTPMVTLRLFLTQILNGNCAIVALRQLAGIDFAPSSYCEARGRLPLHSLQSLLQWMRSHAEQSFGLSPVAGPRILIADGSSYSMEDTPPLREHFHLPPGTKPGVGYPMGKIMGLLDAVTGLFVSLLALPLFQHDMRGVIGLHPMRRQSLRCCATAIFCWETVRFAALRTFACSRPAACLPACDFTNAARPKHAASTAGASRRVSQPGWTPPPLRCCRIFWTCGLSGTRLPTRDIGPVTF